MDEIRPLLPDASREEVIYKINELVREHNRLTDRFQNTLDVNRMWDGS